MKKLLYIVLLFAGFANAQIVNIPDANFKAKLLSANSSNTIALINGIGYTNVDTNNDGEIQLSEASIINALNFSEFPGGNIQDFTGINSFTNLISFNSAFNNASINIDGLINLQYFYFRNNNSNSSSVFNNLPSLTYFQYTSTMVNSITLNNCPNIQTISASQNSFLTTLTINSIPALKELWASSCNISSISIPNSPLMEEIDLNYNFSVNTISILNSPLLKKLYLKGNNITEVTGFSSNLNNIEQLELSGNDIANLILPSFMPNLQSISFNGTSSNNLDFSNYPNLSSIIVNPGSMLNLDVTNVPLLYQFVVSGNPISVIDLSNNVLLSNLAIFDCPITSLNFSNLSNLTNLSCRGLLIEQLDFSQNTQISSISFHNNLNLIHVNLKSGTVNNINYNIDEYNNVPNLLYVCIDEGDIFNFSIFASPPIIPTSSYCTFTPGGNYNTITGSMLFDADNNGCDTSDLTQPNIKININDGTNQGATFTNNLGNYTFYTLAGSFDITPNVENPTYFNFSPTTATIPFADNNNNATTQNFCISANGVHPDVEIVIAPITPARPGFDAIYKIVYKNKGNQTLSGNITFTYDDAFLDFVSATVVPDAQSIGLLNWNYTNLLPFENRSFEVTLNVNSPTETPAVNIGDIFHFVTTITPVVGDENPLDNLFSYYQTVVGSYDPNNIECLEGNVVPPSEIGNYLHYIINFENTGTFLAENIVVKTTIDAAKFDVNSLQMLNTSHNAYIKQTGNVVEFIFENVALESGGHGNVLLKIRSKNDLVSGDSVSKRADIFFDYNFPIDTGMANTTFQVLSNPGFEVDNSIAIYPNPANDFVNITSNNTIKSVQLYDVQGRLLQTQIIDEVQTAINISEKSNGIYFLKITSEKGIKVEKLVKQ